MIFFNKSLDTPIEIFTAEILVKEELQVSISHAAYNVSFEFREKVDSEIYLLVGEGILKCSRWPYSIVVLPCKYLCVI